MASTASSGSVEVRLVLPHQLFEQHLDAGPVGSGVFVLIEHDLLYRQYRFHRQKLVLHRASMEAFAARLAEIGARVEWVRSDASRSSAEQMDAVLTRLREERTGDEVRVSCFDVVDDWLERDLAGAVDEWLESPNFLTTRDDLARYRASTSAKFARMQHFYTWQRRRLGVLLEDDGSPVGGKWSFDEDNRKKLPKGHVVPAVAPSSSPATDALVAAAIEWVAAEFPDNPGRLDSFRWPLTHEQAEQAFVAFLDERLDQFGPYEDAISCEHAHVFHALLTPALNIGLISPARVLELTLERADDVPLASLEGFVRQLIGWREYMRATYVWFGRRLRSGNHLEHGRKLADGWWTASTGLDPVDLCLDRVLDTGYAHHIERLMVFGNALCLLRVDPDAAYEWFMEMFIDAYDWVMVTNVYAMSQFAAGPAITTKPYVSGSNYLRKMSDLPRGEWEADWDALYWTFVRDHHDVFAGNPRSQMIATLYDRLDPAKKAAHTRRAQPWLEG